IALGDITNSKRVSNRNQQPIKQSLPSLVRTNSVPCLREMNHNVIPRLVSIDAINKHKTISNAITTLEESLEQTKTVLRILAPFEGRNPETISDLHAREFMVIYLFASKHAPHVLHEYEQRDELVHLANKMVTVFDKIYPQLQAKHMTPARTVRYLKEIRHFIKLKKRFDALNQLLIMQQHHEMANDMIQSYGVMKLKMLMLTDDPQMINQLFRFNFEHALKHIEKSLKQLNYVTNIDERLTKVIHDVDDQWEMLRWNVHPREQVYYHQSVYDHKSIHRGENKMHEHIMQQRIRVALTGESIDWDIYFKVSDYLYRASSNFHKSLKTKENDHFFNHDTLKQCYENDISESKRAFHYMIVSHVTEMVNVVLRKCPETLRTQFNKEVGIVATDWRSNPFNMRMVRQMMDCSVRTLNRIEIYLYHDVMNIFNQDGFIKHCARGERQLIEADIEKGRRSFPLTKKAVDDVIGNPEKYNLTNQHILSTKNQYYVIHAMLMDQIQNGSPERDDNIETMFFDYKHCQELHQEHDEIKRVSTSLVAISQCLKHGSESLYQSLFDVILDLIRQTDGTIATGLYVDLIVEACRQADKRLSDENKLRHLLTTYDNSNHPVQQIIKKKLHRMMDMQIKTGVFPVDLLKKPVFPYLKKQLAAFTARVDKVVWYHYDVYEGIYKKMLENHVRRRIVSSIKSNDGLRDLGLLLGDRLDRFNTSKDKLITACAGLTAIKQIMSQRKMKTLNDGEFKALLLEYPIADAIKDHNEGVSKVTQYIFNLFLEVCNRRNHTVAGADMIEVLDYIDRCQSKAYPGCKIYARVVAGVMAQALKSSAMPVSNKQWMFLDHFHDTLNTLVIDFRRLIDRARHDDKQCRSEIPKDLRSGMMVMRSRL
ncbi:hypothetical protein N9N03_02830, partial [Chlamydiia bacterium]|nr:hypothetical protein [Chlamydiia bacterium]